MHRFMVVIGIIGISIVASMAAAWREKRA